MSRRRYRHSPRHELGVGTALLVGGIGFILVGLFSGAGPAWHFVGGVAAMTGAGHAYRAGRNIQHRRARDRQRTAGPPPGGWHGLNLGSGWTVQSAAPTWGSVQNRIGPKVCRDSRCLTSTQPRSTCQCPCGGAKHGSLARGGGGARTRQRGGARTGQRNSTTPRSSGPRGGPRAGQRPGGTRGPKP